jgi:hypothetical protein
MLKVQNIDYLFRVADKHLGTPRQGTPTEVEGSIQ